MEQVTIQSPIKYLITIEIMTIGYLTGSAEVKYFPQVLLGLAKFRIFPVTENLTPEGSVTVVNGLGSSIVERDGDQLTMLPDFFKICNDFTWRFLQ